MRKIDVFAALSILCGGLLFFSSCVNPATSSHNISNERYLFGTYSAVLSSSLYDTDKAIRATAARAKFIEEQRINKFNNIVYLYKDIYDNKVRFITWETEDKLTRIEIKIGKTGDKISSQELLIAIDEELRAGGM